MADFYYKNQKSLILDLVNNPIVSYSDAIKIIFALKFFHSSRTRIVGQGIYSRFEASLNFLGEDSELAIGPR